MSINVVWCFGEIKGKFKTYSHFVFEYKKLQKKHFSLTTRTYKRSEIYICLELTSNINIIFSRSL